MSRSWRGRGKGPRRLERGLRGLLAGWLQGQRRPARLLLAVPAREYRRSKVEMGWPGSKCQRGTPDFSLQETGEDSEHGTMGKTRISERWMVMDSEDRWPGKRMTCAAGQRTGNHFRSPGTRKGNFETFEGRVSFDSYFESIHVPTSRIQLISSYWNHFCVWLLTSRRFWASQRQYVNLLIVLSRVPSIHRRKDLGKRSKGGRAQEDSWASSLMRVGRCLWGKEGCRERNRLLDRRARFGR